MFRTRKRHLCHRGQMLRERNVPWFQLPSVASQLIYSTLSCKIDKFSTAITIFTSFGFVQLVSRVSSLPLWLSASQSTECRLKMAVGHGSPSARNLCLTLYIYLSVLSLFLHRKSPQVRTSDKTRLAVFSAPYWSSTFIKCICFSVTTHAI